MTTANADFADLMPHRIEVMGKDVVRDNYGQPVNSENSRIYMCLLDDSRVVTRTASGTDISTAFTAYVAPVPVGATDDLPVPILEGEKVTITLPFVKNVVVNGIENHYDSEDGVGMLHNITLRMD